MLPLWLNFWDQYSLFLQYRILRNWWHRYTFEKERESDPSLIYSVHFLSPLIYIYFCLRKKIHFNLFSMALSIILKPNWFQENLTRTCYNSVFLLAADNICDKKRSCLTINYLKSPYWKNHIFRIWRAVFWPDITIIFNTE